MTFEEMKTKRAELLEKADKARHEPDIFCTGENMVRARKYQEQADELLKQMCIAKGVDPCEIL